MQDNASKVKKHIKKMKNSLSVKLSVVFIGVALILITASLISVFIVIHKERDEYANREAENVLNSLSVTIRSDLDSLRNVTRLIMGEQRVRNFLRAKSDDVTLDISEDAKLGVLEILNITSGVDSVFVFRNDSKYISTIMRRDYRFNEDRMHQREWRLPLLDLKGRASLTFNGNGAIFKTTGETVLTINRAIYDIVTQELTGFLFMNISTSILEDELDNISNENVCVMSTDGNYLAGNQALIDDFDEEYTSETIVKKKISRGSGGMYLFGVKLKNLPLTILYSIKEERFLLPLEILYLIIILPIVYFIGVFAAGTFVKHNITNPIFALTSEMEKNKDKEGIKKITLELPDNEIGMLKDSYNNMVDHSNMLLEKLLEKEQTLQKAELRVLHEQIKPHFLYNSLETIGFLAVDAGADKVHSALETLGSFYRNFLSKGDREIPLSKEVSIIKDYLSLQKLRYGDILLDEYDIAEDTENFVIPKLILQPIVENSIYHGIRLKGEPGVIKISSFLENDELHIVVKDTGVGMSEEQIEGILKSENKKEIKVNGDSFGLWGTIERLRFYCDREDVVKIRSEIGEYTEIEFMIPRKYP